MDSLFLASFLEVLSFIGYIMLALLVLLVMITVHEFGHFIAGKIFKFGINEFAIGFGPKIFSKVKRNGEVFSIRALPLGGFCSFKGEDQDDPDPSAFNNKKPWQRLIVLVSGALMNYILAVVIIVLMFSFYGQSAIMTYTVEENPPAIYTEDNSFVSRDVVLKVNGKNVYILTDFISALDGKKEGDSVDVTLVRKGKIKDVKVLLRSDTDFQNIEDTQTLCDALGITYDINLESGQIENIGLRSTGVKRDFFTTLVNSFTYSFKLAGTIFTVFGQLFTGSLGLNSLGGTVTTISVTANAIKVGGLWSLLNIAGFIGVNLAVFNLLPFPALDGSRALFTLIEWIRKKPLNRKVEGIIHAVGFIVLITFAIFADLQQCF